MEAKTTTLSLDELIQSKLNVRHTEAEGIDELAANIEQLGLLQPLVVRKINQAYEVTDGGRRLAALRRLKEKGVINGGQTVPVLLRDDDDATASAVSLSANIMRLPLHEADQYEAFSTLERQGKSVQEIAKLFSIKKKQVAQALALGSLAPEVLEAYRTSSNVTKEIVEILTRVDHDTQKKILPGIVKGRTRIWELKEALAKEQLLATSPLARFVGTKEYSDAGGTIVKDLFGGSEYWCDRELAVKLAKKKADEIKDKLVDEDGWKWVLSADEAPGWERWVREYPNNTFANAEDEARAKEIDKRLDELNAMGEQSPEENAKLDAEQEALEAENEAIAERFVDTWKPGQKKKLGVIIDFKSAEIFHFGYRHPDDVKAERKKAKDKAKQKGESKLNESSLSAALEKTLSNVLLDAARLGVSRDPAAADNLIIWAMLDANRHLWSCPARVTTAVYTTNEQADGFTPNWGKHLKTIIADCGLDKGTNGDEIYEKIAKLTPAKRAKLKAALVAAHLEDGGTFFSDVVKADPAEIFKVDETFLNRLSKSQMFVALREAGLSLPPETMKKGEVVTFCVRELGKVGWLPPTLRTAQYKGPSKKPKAAKSKA